MKGVPSDVNATENGNGSDYQDGAFGWFAQAIPCKAIHLKAGNAIAPVAPVRVSASDLNGPMPQQPVLRPQN